MNCTRNCVQGRDCACDMGMWDAECSPWPARIYTAVFIGVIAGSIFYPGAWW